MNKYIFITDISEGIEEVAITEVTADSMKEAVLKLVNHTLVESVEGSGEEPKQYKTVEEMVAADKNSEDEDLSEYWDFCTEIDFSTGRISYYEAAYYSSSKGWVGALLGKRFIASKIR